MSRLLEDVKKYLLLEAIFTVKLVEICVSSINQAAPILLFFVFGDHGDNAVEMWIVRRANYKQQSTRLR
jgi:hypothetical protein